MTELDPATEVAQDLLSKPAEFDARAHLRGASHAKDTVAVFTDGEAAAELEALQKAILDAESEVAVKEANGGLVPEEGHDEAVAKVEELKAKQEPLIRRLLESKETYHLRGVPRELLKVIDKKARRAVKPPARKNYSQDADGEEEYELEAFERNIERNDLANWLLVAAAIVKVEDIHGNVDSRPWKAEEAELLQGKLYDSQWYQILKRANELTAGQHLFSSAVEYDADFLSKR